MPNTSEYNNSTAESGPLIDTKLILAYSTKTVMNSNTGTTLMADTVPELF